MKFILWSRSLQLCCDFGEFEVALCEVEPVGGLKSFLFTGTKLGRRLYHSYVFICGSRPRHDYEFTAHFKIFMKHLFVQILYPSTTSFFICIAYCYSLEMPTSLFFLCKVF